MARTYGNFTDFIDFSRASSGTALRKVSYEAELVANGTFDTDVSGWTGADCSIAAVSGELEATYTAATQWVYAPVNTTAGKVYKVIVQGRSDNAVNWRIQAQDSVFGGTLLEQGPESAFTASLSTKELTFVAVSDTTVIELFMRLTSGTAYFDNISVKEVTFDQPSGDLVLFNHPDDIPRVEYDSNGVLKGLLIEEARTNFAPESNGWAGAGFQSGSSTTLTANYGASPDGTQNSTRVQFSGGLVSYNRVEDIISGTFANLTHTVSFWMRSTDGSNQIARLKCTHGGVSDYFSSDQTITGEWQRFSFTQAFGSGGTSVVAGVVNGSSGEAADIEVYGLQVELDASFPTSYIPTSGATATRSADIASIATANFGYNKKAGTVVVEVDLPNLGNTGSGSEGIASFVANAAVENVGLYKKGFSTASQVRYEVRSSNASQATIDLTVPQQNSKMAYSFAADRFNLCVDGGLGTEDTSGNVPSGVTDLSLGNIYSVSGNNFLNGHIKSIKYIPRRNSNTQLQEFTS